MDLHGPLRLKVIARVLDQELTRASAYFERWDMPSAVSNVLPELELVGLDWFMMMSYHDVRMRRPSEGQIHIDPPLMQFECVETPTVH